MVPVGTVQLFYCWRATLKVTGIYSKDISRNCMLQYVIEGKIYSCSIGLVKGDVGYYQDTDYKIKTQNFIYSTVINGNL